MDIKITYETLFDLLRKERSSSDLQLLDSSFWHDIIEYLSSKEKELQEKKGLSEIERLKLQVKNVKKIIQEIYEKREKKIMNIALNVVRTDTSSFVDTQNMLEEEETLFKETLKILKKYKRNVLLNVFEGLKPDVDAKENKPLSGIGKENFEDNDDFDDMQESDEEITQESVSEPIDQEIPKPTSEIEETLPEETVDEDKPLIADEEGRVKVKFTSSVPKFLGKNKNVFGPFNEGDSATLPQNIVEILIKKGKVVAE